MTVLRTRTGLSLTPDRQRGVVIFIAMLAIIALLLAGAALDRAVGTDAATSANVAERTRMLLAAPIAVEHAVAALFEGGIADAATDDLVHNYFAAKQAGDDARGVPRALQSITRYPAEATVLVPTDGYALRHVIERLCLRDGPPAVDHCTLSPPANVSDAPSSPRAPYYRVTVRADGPAGSAAFVQVLLGGDPAARRLSWRALDD
jgi:hypothetical protein